MEKSKHQAYRWFFLDVLIGVFLLGLCGRGIGWETTDSLKSGSRKKSPYEWSILGDIAAIFDRLLLIWWQGCEKPKVRESTALCFSSLNVHVRGPLWQVYFTERSSIARRNMTNATVALCVHRTEHELSCQCFQWVCRVPWHVQSGRFFWNLVKKMHSFNLSRGPSLTWIWS